MKKILDTRYWLLAIGYWLFFSCSPSKNTATPKKTAAQTVANSAAPVVEPAINNVANKFLLKDSTMAVVFFKIGFNQHTTLEYFSKNYTINYALYPDFGSKERLGYGSIIADGSNTTVLNSKLFLVAINLKRPSSNPANTLMLTEIVKIGTAQKATKDVSIRFRSSKLNDQLALFDKNVKYPQMKNYLTVNDTFSIAGVGKKPEKLYVYRYKHDFDAANSPMNTNPRTSSKTLKIDSSFTASSNSPLQFSQEGLYYFLKDSTDAFGLGVVIADKRFPKMTRPEDLIKPVLYISQNQEIMELKGTQDFKKSLDKYWLTLANGNTEMAKQTLRAYYKRVEEANALFTTYKEGWKTDMGMVYIVMGPPDDTRRGRDREVWVYNQRSNFSEINFTFNRRPNQFVEDHYELQRFVEYQPIWYPIVETWRSGVVRDE